jgi:hypothetical protein
MNSKVSRLIRVGSLIHSAEGEIYRCTSKVASQGDVIFRLANLQGKSVQTPKGFCPIPSSFVRFAAWMRYVVAYNKDFDMYVKAYIQQAGLPVDHTMDWAKWFSTTIGPKLMSRDIEIQDEAIHQIIIQTLAERSVLDSSNPNGFSHAIKRFPERIQNLPLERQVTVFLFQAFMWRVSAANDYIKKVIFQKDTESMWGGTEEQGINLLDTEEHANMGDYSAVDADIDIDRFRRGFSDYLHNKYDEGLAEPVLTLFDLLYEEIKESNGDMPKPSDIAEDYYKQVEGKCTACNGKGCSECNRGVTKGRPLKVLFHQLPILIDRYISKHLGEKYQIHPYLEILKNVGKRRSLQPAMASVKTADSGFYGMDVAPMDAGGQFVEGVLDPSGNSQSSGSGYSGGGGAGAIPPPSMGDIGGEAEGAVEGIGEAAAGIGEVGEAAAGVGEAAEALAPLALIAAEKVGNSAYQDGYKAGVADRNLGKEANRANTIPGYSPISRKYCQGYYDGYHNLKHSDPDSLKMAGKQWETPTCKSCGTTKGAKGCPSCKDKFCGSCLLDHHANHPAHDKVAAEEEGTTVPTDIHTIIEEVIGSGLFESEGDEFFTWRGCDYCGPGRGCTVETIKGYRNLEDAHKGTDKLYDFNLCSHCLNKLYYGESETEESPKMASIDDSLGEYLGKCTEDEVIEKLFGDATRFAQALEDEGNVWLDDNTCQNKEYGVTIKYDPETDTHSFYKVDSSKELN